MDFSGSHLLDGMSDEESRQSMSGKLRRRPVSLLLRKFEGIFRQLLIYKQRSRDTTWFSITDTEWPARRAAFEAWLAPDNFDAAGAQRQPLSAFMKRF